METYLGVIIQTAIILVTIGISYGALRAGMLSLDKRLEKLEEANLTVLLGRLEERYNAMDQRVMAQGTRMDAHATTTANIISSQAALINSRLEAINTIVAGHTARFDRMPPLRGGLGGGAA